MKLLLKYNSVLLENARLKRYIQKATYNKFLDIASNDLIDKLELAEEQITKLKANQPIKTKKKIVYICSPLKGNNKAQIKTNLLKAKEHCIEAYKEDCIPIAPHLYLTQFLDDNNEEERQWGMEAGIELLKKCDELWVYGTPSEGMQKEIDWWTKHTNKPIKEVL